MSDRTGQHYIVAGEQIYVAEYGSADKPALVLIHGLMSSGYAWGRVVPALAEHFRVIIPDLPCSGRSNYHDAFSMQLTAHLEVVVALLDVLKIPSAAVAGQSMGGAIGMLLAARYPDRVTRLVLVDPICYPFRLPLKGRLALAPAIGPLLIRYLYRRGMFAAYCRKDVYFDRKKVTDEEINLFYSYFNSPVGRRAALRGMRAVTHVGWLAEDILRITTPTLILWGQHDRLIPVSLADLLHSDIQGSRLEVISNCGHQMISECPAAFLEHALPFLTSTP